MNTLVPLLVMTLLIGLLSGSVIWIVGKLRLGLEVRSFGSAFIAGILIAFVAGVITLLLGLAGFMDSGGLVGGIVHLIIAAIVIAFVAGVITLLLGLAGIEFGGGLVGGIVHLIIAAIVLMISDRFLSGLKVAGFGGALVASIAIGAVYWLGGLLLGAVI